MRPFIGQLRPALLAVIATTILCGVVYPLIVTVIGQVAFNDEANGSLVKIDGVVVGSELVGQNFVAPRYFHPRPSAAGAGHDALSSSGSNLGPTNADLIAQVEQRVTAYRADNGLSDDVMVPVDAVTASGSGLDPGISVANARLQAPRVARARGLALDVVMKLIDEHTNGRQLAVLGEPTVEVLTLNLALDELTGRK